MRKLKGFSNCGISTVPQIVNPWLVELSEFGWLIGWVRLCKKGKRRLGSILWAYRTDVIFLLWPRLSISLRYRNAPENRVTSESEHYRNPHVYSTCTWSVLGGGGGVCYHLLGRWGSGPEEELVIETRPGDDGGNWAFPSWLVHLINEARGHEAEGFIRYGRCWNSSLFLYGDKTIEEIIWIG